MDRFSTQISEFKTKIVSEIKHEVKSFMQDVLQDVTTLHKDFTSYKESVDQEIIQLSNHYEKVENHHRYLQKLFGGIQESPDLDSDEEIEGSIHHG